MAKTRGLSNFITICSVFLVAVGLVAFPDSTSDSAKNALLLCGNVLIPSLFPFFVLSTFVTESGLGALLGKHIQRAMRPLFHVCGAGASAFVLGLLGGYPVGAATVCELYARKVLNKSEAERLLGFCNNCGPAFIFGAIGGGIFKSFKVGLLIYISHILASFLTGIIFRFYRHKDEPSADIFAIKNGISPLSFTDAIKKALMSTLNVCSFVIFFSVLIEILNIFKVLPALCALLGNSRGANCAIIGILELTSGMLALPENAVVLASFLIGFGGFSVHAQALSFISETSLSAKTYFGGKLLHAVFSAIISFLIVFLTNGIM